MASSENIYKFRQLIGDYPQPAFNTASADGINASWVLTNSPVEPASESIYLDGITQNLGSTITTITEDVSIGNYTIVVDDLSNISINDELFLSSDADPPRYKVVGIDTTDKVVTLNRPLFDFYASGASVNEGSKTDYSMSYRNGIVFFDAAPTIGTVMNATYYYYKNSDELVTNLLNQAIGEVGIEINTTPDLDNPAHRALVFLKAHVILLNKDITAGAGSAIKVKQGSTSLDLVGANRALQGQLKEQNARYGDLMIRYLMGQLEGSLGTAVVGDGDYIS